MVLALRFIGWGVLFVEFCLLEIGQASILLHALVKAVLMVEKIQ